MSVNDLETCPPLREALASFSDILLKGEIELTVTIHSHDGEPLTQIRNRCGGKIEQTAEWKWQLKGEDAAMLITTAYALSGFYERRRREPKLVRRQLIEGEDAATLIAAAYVLSSFYEPRRRGRMVSARRPTRVSMARRRPRSNSRWSGFVAGRPRLLGIRSGHYAALAPALAVPAVASWRSAWNLTPPHAEPPPTDRRSALAVLGVEVIREMVGEAAE